MDFDDDLPEEMESETGSDELLSDDNLRLPDSASPLVRLHAVRSWLARRRKETTIEIGESALALQAAQQEAMSQMNRLRRREQQELSERIQQTQRAFQDAQQHLEAFEEATSMLEDCLNHTTSSERALVEYYLSIDALLQQEEIDTSSIQHQILSEVLHRVEQVGAPHEE
jgi:septal ring factor EnvC (AmiA/AmiB activator)